MPRFLFAEWLFFREVRTYSLHHGVCFFETDSALRVAFVPLSVLLFALLSALLSALLCVLLSALLFPGRYTALERASLARRTALMEYLHRQQILPLDFNLTFERYHTYDEHRAKGEAEAKAIRESQVTTLSACVGEEGGVVAWECHVGAFVGEGKKRRANDRRKRPDTPWHLFSSHFPASSVVSSLIVFFCFAPVPVRATCVRVRVHYLRYLRACPACPACLPSLCTP